jgi:hypothetical protein
LGIKSQVPSTPRIHTHRYTVNVFRLWGFRAAKVTPHQQFKKKEIIHERGQPQSSKVVILVKVKVKFTL